MSKAADSITLALHALSESLKSQRYDGSLECQHRVQLVELVSKEVIVVVVVVNCSSSSSSRRRCRRSRDSGSRGCR